MHEVLVGEDLVPQVLDLGTLVKKRWPPMSKRQPSRSTVRLMPPTTSSASSTVAVPPALAELVGGGEARRGRRR
jgi:hypothetical protein